MSYNNPFARNWDFQIPKISWTDSHLNGGTGVSKLTPGLESTAQVLESVEKFNDPTVYIHNGELHSSRKPLDLSDFWKFHRELHGIKMP